MPRCSWHSMNAQSLDAHLVVAMRPVGQRVGQPSVDFLCDFIEALGIEGPYAVTESEGRAGSRVQCAFGDEPDAERFADALVARWTPPDGWASRSVFDLDLSAVRAIEAALAGTRRGVAKGVTPSTSGLAS
jgi:hypothetical protein